jgi:hypothetical protein
VNYRNKSFYLVVALNMAIVSAKAPLLLTILLICIFGLYLVPQHAISISNSPLQIASWIVLSTAAYSLISVLSWDDALLPYFFVFIFWIGFFYLNPPSSLGFKLKLTHVFWTLMMVLAYVVVSASEFNFKLSLLALGYDNYGHLFQSRAITEQGQNFLIEPVRSITNVVTDTPQGAASSLAAINSLLGNSNSIDSFTNLYFAAQLMLPAFFLIIVLRISSAQKWLVPSLLIGTVVFGHLGRIWFSGYFASNLATLLFGLAVYKAATQKKSIIREQIIFLAAIMILWPPLGVVYGTILVIQFLLFREFLNFRMRVREASSPNRGRLILSLTFRSAPMFVVCIAGFLTIWWTYMAIARSFGIDQYVGKGGIESPGFFVYVASSFLLFAANVFNFDRNQNARPMVLGSILFLIAIAVITQSFFGEGLITYYPAKILIAVVHAQILMTAATFRSRRVVQPRSSFAYVALVGVLVLQVGLFSGRSETFSSGYMGRMYKTLTSAISNESEVVDIRSIKPLQIFGREQNRYVLYLSDAHESELNTRWINTLNMKWNNSDWEAWMTVRSLLQSSDFGRADSLIYKSKVVVVVSETYAGKTFSELSDLLPIATANRMLCELKSEHVSHCG